MTDNSQRQKGRDGTLSTLSVVIDGLNFAKEVADITPAKAAFGSVAILLTMIRDMMINDQDYVDLGLSCADICKALERGMGRKRLEDLSKSVCDAISQLTATVAEIQEKVIKRSRRHRISQFVHSRNDKDKIAAWKSHLNSLLHVFNTELILNTHIILADIQQSMSKVNEGSDDQGQVTQNSVPGEPPPPPPRAFFGREGLVNRIVCFAESLTPIALIGAGGIGKTSIILTVLHDDRIKQRFGNNRRFIRCDEFPASCIHFLRQLSTITGAGIENPKNLSSLRSFLSSKEMFIVLDNAEYILDPQGPNAQEIYAAVNELTQFSNICLCVTSRISTIPPDCETLEIPTLSMEAAHDTFYRIYKRGERSDAVGGILEQLDFHPLSITLLATVAQYNKWGTDRLTMEWERRRTGVLDVQHTRSLATTIELSLASPMFQELGPDARPLLEVIAFFPQGVNEKNVSWLFPTITNVPNMFDKFCVLSLAYRNNGFITMLAPLRDHLCPKDPASSPLLNTTKENYFTRLPGEIVPGTPGFEEARWITTEDINVEHLLDVFTTIDTNSKSVWDACSKFMAQLYWHKSRLVVTLGPKIEALPDNHPSKAQCLLDLSRLLDSVGNFVERKRLLSHSLKLWREQGNDFQVARALRNLSDANRQIGLYEEGILQAKEASETFERLGRMVRQAECLTNLAFLLCEANQLDAAEEAGSRAIDLLPEKGEELWVCQAHRVLGNIYRSKGETEKAVHHLEISRGVASSLNMAGQLFWVNFALAGAFSEGEKFDEAHVHVERARSYAVDDTYLLACASLLQARLWCKQGILGEAKSVALSALEVFEKLGAASNSESARWLLQQIDELNESDDDESEDLDVVH